MRAHLFDLGQEVAGDHHRPALDGDGLQQISYLGNPCRVESVCGFVQDEQIRVGKQG